MSLSRFLTFFLLSTAVLFLPGCSLEKIGQDTYEKLEYINQRLGGNDDKATSTESVSQASDLSLEQRQKIDGWLEENNLNRYGDSQGVIYPGGTPLYNKETGESINRFDYILERYPDILERINN